MTSKLFNQLCMKDTYVNDKSPTFIYIRKAINSAAHEYLVVVIVVWPRELDQPWKGAHFTNKHLNNKFKWGGFN